MKSIVLFIILVISSGIASAYTGSESGYHIKLVTPQEFSDALQENTYRMNFIVNPTNSGFLRTEGIYKISLSLYPGSTGVRYSEQGYRLYLVPEQAFISYTCGITANDPDCNHAPVVEAGGDRLADEGAAVLLEASFTDADGGDTHTAVIDWGDSTAPETGMVDQNTHKVTGTHVYADNGIYTVAVKVTDSNGAKGSDTLMATINNIPPAVGLIAAPIDPVPVNTQITASSPFTDPGVKDTHTAEWSWGDGTTSSGTVTENEGSGSVNDTHVYYLPGVYTVTLNVTHDDGGKSSSVYRFVVVYDPNGGFVTGGGWIESPPGAYYPDASLSGKAHFGFVSRYQKGAKVPTGKTDFKFQVADLDFHSEVYEWLVISGARAQYKGTGSINGAGNYGFILTAIDGAISGGGGTDKFRIKIWDRNNADAVVYDNQLGAADDAVPATVIQGGSIVMHTEK